MLRKVQVLASLLLLLSPVCGYLLNYKHYSNQTTWGKAQSHCRSQHTDLVTIRNEKENDFYKPGRGWIGLYRHNDSDPWKWSRGDRKADFKKLASGATEFCAFMDQNKDWKTDECTKDHTYMCYDERLVLVTENKTWEEALHHCRSLGGVDPNNPTAVYRNHHYDLATLSIHANDLDYALETIKEATTEEVWTGLRYLAGKWMWVDNQPMPYEEIRPCPNNNFCGVLEKNSSKAYEIRDCDGRKNFLCYKRPQL